MATGWHQVVHERVDRSANCCCGDGVVSYAHAVVQHEWVNREEIAGERTVVAVPATAISPYAGPRHEPTGRLLVTTHRVGFVKSVHPTHWWFGVSWDDVVSLTGCVTGRQGSIELRPSSWDVMAGHHPLGDHGTEWDALYMTASRPDVQKLCDTISWRLSRDITNRFTGPIAADAWDLDRLIPR